MQGNYKNKQICYKQNRPVQWVTHNPSEILPLLPAHGLGGVHSAGPADLRKWCDIELNIQAVPTEEELIAY